MAFSRYRLLPMLIVAALLSLAVAASAADEKPDNPREMFRSLGVDDGYFGRLVDGKPFDASENESLLRILFHLRTFPQVDIERWALNPDALAEAIQEPELARGSIYRLRGRVVDVQPINSPDEAAQRYEMPRYFRCRLQLSSSAETVDVYTEQVPAAWQKGAEPNVSGGAFGVFLKLAENTGDVAQPPSAVQDRTGQPGAAVPQSSKSPPVPRLLFAARRLAWYPDDLMGRLGMDVGLLDCPEARRVFNRRNPEDREAFYQLLAAVGRAAPGELLQQAEADLPQTPPEWLTTDRQGLEQYSVVPLFNDPASQIGRLVELFGTAWRVKEIHLDRTLDADIIARFGFDHYYEVYLFTDESQNNPLTFCVRQLPEGMPYGNLPHYGETVRVAGFFFKTWSYGVLKLTDPALQPGDPKTLQQLSPLLIGNSLVWYPAPQAADNMLTGWMVGGVCVLLMLVIWLMAWHDRRHERRLAAEMERPPRFDADIEIGPAGHHSEAAPDFSNLAQQDRGESDLAFGPDGLEPDKPFEFRPEP
jgi:hypothetical protein